MTLKGSNTKEFLLKAKKVHGNKYDYSQVIYIKSSIKVNIICKHHGTFSQTPQNHLRGSGCPICARKTKYTKEVCINEAKKYKTRSDFRNNSSKIYYTACNKHWLDEICTHMEGKIKHKAGWWENIDNCITTASLYRSPQELKKAECGCHASISKHKWQDICYQHMKYRKREYTENQLIEIAKQCKTHREFRIKFSGAYSSAKKKNIYNKICQHMPPLRIVAKSRIPLTYENCKRIANEFKSRSEFQQFENGRWYQYAQRHNILDEICMHMPRIGNKKKRCIYAAEFEDNSAYIGLTYFAERRWSDHMRTKNSTVNKHIEETGLTPKWKKLTDYIDYQEASKQEGIWKERYVTEGWIVLNKAKTGSLGGAEGYTLEEILKEASKYDTLPKFFKGSPGYYQSAYRNGWMKNVKQICDSQWRGSFTEAELRDIFSKYDDITKLRKDRHAAIDAARKLGIIEKLTKDYVVKPKKHYKIERFTEQYLYDIAKQYKYRSEFKQANSKAYDNARRKGILDKVCSHMKKMPRPKIEFTENEIRIEALKYNRRSDFLKHAKIAAKRAQELGIYEDVCSHMKDTHWKYTKEEAIKIANQYRNRTELFNNNKAAYKRLEFYKLLDLILPVGEPYNLKWTDEARCKAAAQCKTRKEFKKKYPQAMDITRVKKDWNIIAPHLKPLTRRLSEGQIAEICRNVKNMQELKEYDYKLWYNCNKHPNRRRIAEKYFKKE